MKKLLAKIFAVSLVLCLGQFDISFAQEILDESSPFLVNSLGATATWENNSGEFVYRNGTNGATNPLGRALLYSQDALQSDDGFVITIEYTTGSIQDSGDHDFSFGLISNETNLANYTGFNPFEDNESVFSIGVNLIGSNAGSTGQGMNYNDGNQVTFLDQSGTRSQFAAGQTTKVTMEIGFGGSWTYRINDVYEASGAIAGGIDLSKSYHLAVYAQDDNGGGKSIQSITVEKNYAPGERAASLRGTWNITFKANNHANGRVEDISIEPFLETIKDLRTLNSVALWLSISSTNSSTYSAPHRLLESFSEGDTDNNGEPLNLVVPRWGNGVEPENDPFGDWAAALKAEGFKVKVYINSENLIGNNLDEFADVADRWKDWCDTAPEAQAFISSQPYHTGIWNGNQYVDASGSHPERKYVFCWAEFIIKEYALRYGHLIDSWIFDSAKDLNQHGDDFSSGEVEDQRIYQAIANAIHAGNPKIPIAFQNGRSTINYFAYPFQNPSRFDDFTFGHAFGGNNNHAEKVNGNQFDQNYQHIERLTETNGNVFDGGPNTWDDLVVGNFHSKLSTTSWSGGNTLAWEQDDFNEWNLEAISAGGSMTWGIPHIINNKLNDSFNMQMQPWALELIYNLDDYLFANGVGPSCIPGDVNRDSVVNFADIASFIALLTTGGFSCEADIDGNGSVNFIDISHFIALLAG